MDDPESAEAFEMYDEARRQARRILAAPPASPSPEPMLGEIVHDKMRDALAAAQPNHPARSQRGAAGFANRGWGSGLER